MMILSNQRGTEYYDDPVLIKEVLNILGRAIGLVTNMRV
jgi:hypothetical protein